MKLVFQTPEPVLELYRLMLLNSSSNVGVALCRLRFSAKSVAVSDETWVFRIRTCWVGDRVSSVSAPIWLKLAWTSAKLVKLVPVSWMKSWLAPLA